MPIVHVSPPFRHTTMSISIARACPSPTQCVNDLWQFALYSNDGADCTEDNSKRRSREFITLQGPDVLSEHDIGRYCVRLDELEGCV